MLIFEDSFCFWSENVPLCVRIDDEDFDFFFVEFEFDEDLDFFFMEFDFDEDLEFFFLDPILEELSDFVSDYVPKSRLGVISQAVSVVYFLGRDDPSPPPFFESLIFLGLLSNPSYL